MIISIILLGLVIGYNGLVIYSADYKQDKVLAAVQVVLLLIVMAQMLLVCSKR